MKINYYDYIQSDEWREKADAAKERTLSLSPIQGSGIVGPPAADTHPAPRLEGRGTALIAQLAQAKKVAK